MSGPRVPVSFEQGVLRLVWDVSPIGVSDAPVDNVEHDVLFVEEEVALNFLVEAAGQADRGQG